MLSYVRKRYRAGLRLALGAAVAVAGVAAFTTPAQADPAHPGTVQGTFKNDVIDGFSVQLTGMHERAFTALFDLAVDGGGDLSAYCIDLHTSTGPGRKYSEADWSAKNVGSDLTKINWILHNSYPAVGNPAEIGKGISHADKYGLPDSNLTKREAVTATQAAIWHYSDGVNLKLGAQKGNAAEWKRIDSLYKFLTNDTINTGIANQPAPTIALGDGHNMAGSPDKPIGPITVHTSASTVTLTLTGAPSGTKLLVKHGDTTTESNTAVNGDKLFVQAPQGADTGSATLTATVTGKVATGRVFVGDPANSIQKLILAGSGPVSASASTKVAWSQKPVPAFTATSETVCSSGGQGHSGVKVTIANTGKAAGTVTVANGNFSKSLNVAAGSNQSVLVPVTEGAKYHITVSAGEFHQEFTGTENCAVASPSSSPTPSPSTSPVASSGGLPVTGTSLPIIVGAGLVLLAAGGVLLFLLRRRRNLTTGS